MTDSRYLQVFGDATDALLRCAGIDEAYRESGRVAVHGRDARDAPGRGARARAAVRHHARARGGRRSACGCSTLCTARRDDGARRHRRADVPARDSEPARPRRMAAGGARAARGAAGGAGRLPPPPEAGPRAAAGPSADGTPHAQDRRSRAAPRRDRPGRLPGRGAARLRAGDHRAHRARGRLHHRHGGALLRHQAGHHHRGAAPDPAAHRGAPHAERAGRRSRTCSACSPRRCRSTRRATSSAPSGSPSGARCRRTGA